jgi:uncharacterized protein YukE
MDGFEYHVPLLLALADRFDDHAETVEQNLDQLLKTSRDTALQCAAMAVTWRRAAKILRQTALTPPDFSV